MHGQSEEQLNDDAARFLAEHASEVDAAIALIRQAVGALFEWRPNLGADLNLHERMAAALDGDDPLPYRMAAASNLIRAALPEMLCEGGTSTPPLWVTIDACGLLSDATSSCWRFLSFEDRAIRCKWAAERAQDAIDSIDEQTPKMGLMR
ncbi:MAG: hypothetical protein Q8O64_05740 [Sideroxyarcus sp.]|nr:hypothetical protein [Sideroxyarcus sp.]